MEDNFTQMIEMVGATLLFVFALSFAVISYNNVSTRADMLIEINSVNRRGDTTNTNLTSDDITRKTNRAEIIISILNLERTVQTTGNSNYVINVKDGAKTYEFRLRSRPEDVESTNDLGETVTEEVKRNYVEFVTPGHTFECYLNAIPRS